MPVPLCEPKTHQTHKIPASYAWNNQVGPNEYWKRNEHLAIDKFPKFDPKWAKPFDGFFVLVLFCSNFSYSHRKYYLRSLFFGVSVAKMHRLMNWFKFQICLAPICNTPFSLMGIDRMKISQIQITYVCICVHIVVWSQRQDINIVSTVPPKKCCWPFNRFQFCLYNNEYWTLNTAESRSFGSFLCHKI